MWIFRNSLLAFEIPNHLETAKQENESLSYAKGLSIQDHVENEL